jgi:hypothetical protein
LEIPEFLGQNHRESNPNFKNLFSYDTKISRKKTVTLNKTSHLTGVRDSKVIVHGSMNSGNEILNYPGYCSAPVGKGTGDGIGNIIRAGPEEILFPKDLF